MKNLYLVCNAHIDPVWQWERDEGIGTVLSTFRAAADLCEEFDGFVFNHNEAMLYKWVEDYEPSLFERIQRLVKAGRWHIMGGWYLQPDCNMPSGESFVRQMEEGRRYFGEKFGCEPKVAINFDPFGHTKGLVQIMQQAGYTGYLFCRPTDVDFAFPADNFTWRGFNGSSVKAHHSGEFYSSSMGRVCEKISSFLPSKNEDTLLMLWGVGNHGGGPSRKDITDIAALDSEMPDIRFIHSTPEEFFDNADFSAETSLSLGRCQMGCYSSLIKLKQAHRRLENELRRTEVICSHAAHQGLAAYPSQRLHEALEALLYSEFHDILPGSCTHPVEDEALAVINRGLDTLLNLRARAFFSLCQGEERAADREYPIMIYNPHPFPVEAVIESEFMLAYNDNGDFAVPQVYCADTPLPSQIVKETSNIPLDWRKKVVFRAVLQPTSINRFRCFTVSGVRPVPAKAPEQNEIVFDNGLMKVVINAATGYVDEYTVNGRNFLCNDAFKLLAMRDSEDSWGYSNNNCNDIIGSFKLCSPADAAKISAVHSDSLPPVRVIEDGAVRTVVECIFRYDLSFAVVRYILEKHSASIKLDIRIFNNQRDTLYKLDIPTTLTDTVYMGKTAYGVDDLPCGGCEVVSQEWNLCRGKDYAVAVINNGTYASSCDSGVIRPTLMRSCGYCAHPYGDCAIYPQDRFSERSGQGEYTFSYVITGGIYSAVRQRVDTEAAVFNAPPFGISFFPSGKGNKTGSFLCLTNPVIELSSVRAALDGGYIVRLFNPLETTQSTQLTVDGKSFDISVMPMEILSFIYDGNTLKHTSLLDIKHK